MGFAAQADPASYAGFRDLTVRPIKDARRFPTPTLPLIVDWSSSQRSGCSPISTKERSVDLVVSRSSEAANLYYYSFLVFL